MLYLSETEKKGRRFFIPLYAGFKIFVVPAMQSILQR
jgi:hypothetical protein